METKSRTCICGAYNCSNQCNCQDSCSAGCCSECGCKGSQRVPETTATSHDIVNNYKSTVEKKEDEKNTQEVPGKRTEFTT